MDNSKPDLATKLLSVGIYFIGFWMLLVTGVFSPNFWRKIDFISAPIPALLGVTLVYISVKIWTSDKSKWKLMAALVIVPWILGVSYFFHRFDPEPVETNISIDIQLPEIEIILKP